MALTDPSLGTLITLPRELRDLVYVYAAAPRDYEVNIHSNYTIFNPLKDVSHTTRTESTEACKNLVGKGCHHENIKHALGPFGYSDGSILPQDKHGNFSAKSMANQHNLSNTKQLRFITDHLGNDVPTAVVFTFDLPRHASVQIYGASAWTETAVEDALNKETLAIVHDARHPTVLGMPVSTPRDHVKAKEIGRLAVALRNAVCREHDQFDLDDGYYAEN